MVGMQSWLVSWLTRPSLQTQHQRHRLFQNKRVLEVLFYWTHRILLVSPFWVKKYNPNGDEIYHNISRSNNRIVMLGCRWSL